MALKDRIREAGSRIQARKQFDLDLGNGEKARVELRAPSMAEKSEIVRAAAGLSVDKMGEDLPEKIDLAILSAHLILRCLYDPETNERVYARDDVEEVLGLGPVFDEAQTMAMELFSAPKEPAGKSEPTPS